MSQNLAEKELSPTPVNNYLPLNNRNLASYRVDQRLTSAQNALLKTDMDKPKGILSNRRTGSPRGRSIENIKIVDNINIYLNFRTTIVGLEALVHAKLHGRF